MEDLLYSDDIRDAFDNIFMRFGTSSALAMSDDRFIVELKSQILTTKTYDFYIPIYCLYGFPKGVKIGFATVMDFEELPIEIQKHFIFLWKHRFTINTEYNKTEHEYHNLKKRSTFINLVVKSNGNNKALEKAGSLAEDTLHILRFLYGINFNILDIRYMIKENKYQSVITMSDLCYC